MTSSEQTHLDPELAGAWTLDPARTSVTIHTKAMWLLPVKGTARALEGGGTVAADGSVTGTLVIDAASIDTHNKKRDAHLRTADFFEVANHPTITFTATGARPSSSGKVALDGTLTMHGQTRPLTLLAEVAVTGDSVTVTADADIDRNDWGVSWAKMGAGLKNQVAISAHFDRA